MSSEYFAAQAADVFMAAGGDPANSRPLATWAEDARANRDWRRLGVVVAQDGRLIAETIRLNVLAGVTAVYVTDVLIDLPDPDDIDGTILDLACGTIRQQIAMSQMMLAMMPPTGFYPDTASILAGFPKR